MNFPKKYNLLYLHEQGLLLRKCSHSVMSLNISEMSLCLKSYLTEANEHMVLSCVILNVPSAVKDTFG